MVTLSIKDLFLILVFIALIVMLIFLTVLLANAIKTLKELNLVLTDTKSMTDVAARRVDDLDGIISNVSDSVGGVSNALKGKENLAQSLSSVGKAVSSVVGFVKGKGE